MPNASGAVVANAARRLDPAVRELAKVGDVRTLEVDDKGDRLEVVIRVRMTRTLRRS